MTKRSDSKPRVAPRKKVVGLGKATGRKTVKPARSRESRELESLRALLNHSADAMMWVELPSGRILHLNAISRELLEMDPKEVPTVTLGDILSATAVDKIMTLAQEEPRKSGRLAIVTDAFRCPSGMVIPVEMTVGVYVVDRVTNALIVARDISDRMQAEQALQDAHHKIQGLVSAIPDVLYFKDAKGRNLLVNTAFENLVRQSADQIIGKTDAELLPPDLAKYCEDSDRATIESGQAKHWEEMSVSPDGTLVYFDTIKVPLFDDAGKLVGLVGVSRDITDRKRSEQALRDSESRYRTIFENIQDVYFEADTSGTVLEVSPSVERLSHYRRAELIGSSLYDIYADPSERDKIYQKIVAEGFVEDCEIRLRDKDGSFIYCSVNARLETSADGRSAKTRGTIRNITERKRAEQALQQRESYLTAIIENQPGLLWLKDEESRFLAVNHAFARSCGKEHPGELIGKTDMDVWPRELAEQYRNDDRRVIESGTGFTTEEQIFDKEEMRWFETFKTPVHSAQGEILGTTGFARDITERKLAEEKLQLARHRLDQIIEFLPDATLVIDTDSKVIAWNRAMEQMSGVPKEEMIGKGDYAYSIPFYGEPRKLLVDLALLPDGVFEQQHYTGVFWQHGALCAETHVPLVYGGKGAYLSGISTRLLDAHGTIFGAIESIRDITERKVAEAALRYRSDFEQLVSEISTRFISIPRDAIDNEIEAALEKVCQFTGTDAACVQRFSDDLRHFTMTHVSTGGSDIMRQKRGKPTKAPAAGWWFQQISGGEAVAIESVDRLPDAAAGEREQFGSEGIRAVVDVPLTYQGKITGVLGLASMRAERPWSEDEIALLRMVGQVFTNALQRKRFEEEREALEGQLRQSQKMQAVGQLAGGVAHDFNNLLQVINGYTEMAIELLPLEDKARANLEEAARASERAATLVRQLLAFGRRETLHQQYLDLNDVISDLMKMLRRVIGEHIDLNSSAAPGLGSVYADPGQIEQILMNLCVNARDAMADGGTITIETFAETFDADFCHEHSWAKEGQFVALSVSDTGTGISAEVLERIFEPFFTTKEVGKGTGLGLATVYAITERHGGFLHVSSTPGKGSTFDVYFPAAAAKGKPIEIGSAATAKRGHGETILLAEDDELVRELTVRILERANYKVVVACDGDEAVDRFRARQSEISLAIIDVVMPKKSGREVYQIVRQAAPDLPVLFSSGYSYDDLGDTVVTGERVGQIQKPFRPHELIKSIQDMLAVQTKT